MRGLLDLNVLKIVFLLLGFGHSVSLRVFFFFFAFIIIPSLLSKLAELRSRTLTLK